jgi:GMP synthase (glutamine-hydrolysing)
MKTESMLILDFGSQYTHLIKSSLQDIGVFSIIIPADTSCKKWQECDNNNKYHVKGIVLSGGAVSVRTAQIPFDHDWLTMKVPVLGICYGHQLLAKLLGGIVKQSNPEYGSSPLSVIQKSLLTKGVRNGSIVWMSHSDTVMKLPSDCMVLAKSRRAPIAAYQKTGTNIFGIQFHPEVSHTDQGKLIWKNFLFDICKFKNRSKWTAKKFVDHSIASIKLQVTTNKVVAAVSGGVDSLTMLVLLKKAISKNQLIAIYVDSGLMPNETKQEVLQFCNKFDINLQVVDESDRFFNALAAVTNPGKKCKVIGKIFIDILEEIASQYKTKIVAQGTIWSDVIESGITKFSSQIKPHHNVAGLPDELHIELLEPLRELFKDKVRQVARFLKLPNSVVNKKVFPGPGFAIRILGVVTRNKVNLVRNATRIIEETLHKTPIEKDLWMAFAILINVTSLGVQGDQHKKYRQAIVVRVVESTNSMTANFSLKVIPYLKIISKRIVDEVGVGRILYDITDKPPATIEWE